MLRRLGIYDYTLKKSLHSGSDYSDDGTTMIEKFREQILNSYNLLLHDRKQVSWGTI